MKFSREMRAVIAGVLFMAGCKTSLPPTDDHFGVATSFGSWRSNVGTGNHGIGVEVVNVEFPERPVPEEFLKKLSENASIIDSEGVTTRPAVLATNFNQQLIDDNEGRRVEPAEIVFDATGLRSSGWNYLHIDPGLGVSWDGFYSSEVIDAPIRLDSAPAVVTIEFHPENQQPTEDPTLVSMILFFSEDVTTIDGAPFPSRPVRVTGVDGEIDCDAEGSLPTAGFMVRCPTGLKDTITIEFVDQTLQAGGRPVRAVDGSPFVLTVNPLDLPKHYAHVWFPALPPY